MRTVAALLLFTLSFADAQAQPAPAAQGELFKTISALDSELFAAYNSCDLEKFRSLLADDVEFYHDQSGLSVGGNIITEQVKKNICGQVRRELVAGTLQVYPMRDYGAVEIGAHRFYQPKKGPAPTGEAKFIHLWQKKDGNWKITRIISFDHAPLPRE